MEILESREKVCRFYKEHTGIDITAYGQTITELFEGLYYHKAPLTFSRLLMKMEQCGINLSYSGLDRSRFGALCRKVKPEPAFLTRKGACFWYASQPREFNQAEIDFMVSYDPEETLERYPHARLYLEWKRGGRYRLRGFARNSRAKARTTKHKAILPVRPLPDVTR